MSVGGPHIFNGFLKSALQGDARQTTDRFKREGNIVGFDFIPF